MKKIIAGIAALVVAGVGAGIGIAQTQISSAGASSASSFSALSSSGVSGNVSSVQQSMLSDLAGPAQAAQAKQLFVGSGNTKDYSISATKDSSGGFCVDGSYIAACLDQFPKSGVVYRTAMNTDGAVTSTSKQLISGVVSDQVTSLSAQIGSQLVPITIQNGAFVYVASAPGVWVDQLVATNADGSTANIAISDPNRPTS
jgi:hypothetical protein